jgi:uncharacterized iron-regulated protein
MRTTCLLAFLLAFLAGPVLARGACKSIDGLEELLKPGRVFLLGELHGTEQSPSYAFMVACNSAKVGHETVVGLELTSAAQPLVDLYLDSGGSEQDRAALLEHDIWTRSYQDGRTSRAIVGLIEQVRQARRQDLKVDVLFYDIASPRSAQDRERAMAVRLAESMKNRPESVHVVLTGNMHSRVAPGNMRNRDYRPMGNLLLGEIPPSG